MRARALNATTSWVRRRSVVAGLIGSAAAVALAGCGGTPRSGRASGGPEADQRRVRSVVDAYFRAVDARDGRRICAAFTQELDRYIARLQQSPCPEAMHNESRNLPESLNGYRIGEVRIEGRQAFVALGGGPAGTGRMVLERPGASWRISSAPGVGG